MIEPIIDKEQLSFDLGTYLQNSFGIQANNSEYLTFKSILTQSTNYIPGRVKQYINSLESDQIKSRY